MITHVLKFGQVHYKLQVVDTEYKIILSLIFEGEGQGQIHVFYTASCMLKVHEYIKKKASKYLKKKWKNKKYLYKAALRSSSKF